MKVNILYFTVALFMFVYAFSTISFADFFPESFIENNGILNGNFEEEWAMPIHWTLTRGNFSIPNNFKREWKKFVVFTNNSFPPFWLTANETLIKVNSEKRQLWLKGQVPGSKNALVRITKI